ncbi:hypothetical protein G6F55_014542 [Rhizopus delemar]|nr:hypothetical protein G6F55_014542 [Rhizopus delemar]
MPGPASITSMRSWPSSSRACTCTAASGGENLAAFSITLNTACSTSAGCTQIGASVDGMSSSSRTLGG